MNITIAESREPRNTWTDDDWSVFKTWVTEVLRSNEAVVTFTKKDGTERVMRCTLDPQMLPNQQITETKPERKKSETSVAVFDIEAKAWRSFVLKSVLKVSFGTHV